MDRYYVQLYRGGEPQPYTICAITLQGLLTFELWKSTGKREAVCLGRDTSAQPLKDMVE